MRLTYAFVAALLPAFLIVPAAPARADDGSCPVPVPAGTVCGRLTVPERRSDPHSRQISVPFAVHRATGPDRQADPLVFMGGGPGSPSMQLIGHLTAAPFAADRDVIVLEQRGSRLSTPALSCPEIDTTLLDALSRPGADTVERDALATAGRTCRDRLAAAPIDPRGYTTAEIAADVVALRHTLGYPRWNLMGVSYSTRSMLAAAAADPDGTRAVVLDSFLPARTGMYDVATRDLLRTLERMTPGLSATLRRVTNRLDRRPAAVAVTDPFNHRPRTLHLTGSDLATLIMEGMHDADVATVVPPLLTALDEGHDGLLRAVGRIAVETLNSHDTGLYYLVNCQDEVPFNRFALTTPGSFYDGADPAVCRGLNLPAGSTAGATTAAPVLVLGGALDPATPVDTARAEAARTLPHATIVEFAGVAHAVFLGSRCGRETIGGFLAAPANFAPPCDPGRSPYRTLGAHEPHVTTRAYDLADGSSWHRLVPAVLVLASVIALGAGLVRRRRWLLVLAGAGGLAPLGVAAWLVRAVAASNPASLLVGVPRPVSWCVVAAAVLSAGFAAAATRRCGRLVPVLVGAGAATTLVWWFTG